jgi:ABC-type amino acid transport substrate-binding protein
LAAAFAAVALHSLAPSQGDSGPPKRRLIVGTEASYRPMEFIDVEGDGAIVGFDIDLFRAVCEEAGFGPPEFRNIPWDGLFLALNQGAVEVVISSVTITDERKETFLFSDPYLRSGQAILCRAAEKEKYVDLDSLKGKIVGVQLGTTGQFLLEERGGSELKKYDSAPLAIADLLNGNVDAAVIDLPVARAHAKERADLADALHVSENVFSEEYYGIVTRQGEDEIMAAINAGLAKAKEKGVVAELEKKWF